MRRSLRSVLFIWLSALVVLLSNTSVFAISEKNEMFYSSNDILFYDPDWKMCAGGGSSSSTTTTGGTAAPGGASTGGPSGALELTDHAKDLIKSLNIDKRAAENKPVYDFASKATGIPWYVIATVHYRESDMTTGRSLTNGEMLGTGTNVDGLFISDDANADAVNAMKHFITMAKAVYGVDVTKASSAEDWGNAFLAYNRGNLYKVAGKTYLDSPYVMNEYNNNYHDMSWVGGRADPGSSTVGGGKEGRIGALAMMSYLSKAVLGGGGGGCSSTGAGSGDIVQIASAEVGKMEEPIGCDVGNPSTPGNCGPDVSKYTDNHLEYWCADFVSWVYKQAGKAFTGGASGGWRIASVEGVRDWFKAKGSDNYFANGPSANPQPGDVYIIEDGVHIGIVEKVEGDKLYTISGNTSVENFSNGVGVGKRTYDNFKSDPRITGFGRF